MRFYGHTDFNKNHLLNAALQTLTQFPVSAIAEQINFVNSICVNTTSPAICVPLTREITSYVHPQETVSQMWAITHNPNTPN